MGSLARLNLLGYQSNLVHTDAPGNVNHIDDAIEKQLRIALNEHRSFVSCLENLGKPISKVLLGNGFLIDRQVSLWHPLRQRLFDLTTPKAAFRVEAAAEPGHPDPAGSAV